MKKITFLFVVAVFSTLSIYAQDTPPITLFDGEDGTLHARFRNQSSQTLEVADNPLINDVNGSSKVMRMTPFIDPGQTVPSNRCILMIDMLVTSQALITAEDEIYTYGYTNIKLKYYSPNVRGNQIKLQWNAGETFEPVSFYPEGGKWETLDFQFPYDDEDYSRFQILFNENPQSWPGPDYVMYIDDIVVYNANAAGVDNLKFNSLAAHTYHKDGETILSLQSKDIQDVNIELYSMSGQKVENLYKGTVSGMMEIPVNATSGIYIVRISDGIVSEAIKLIVK